MFAVSGTLASLAVVAPLLVAAAPSGRAVGNTVGTITELVDDPVPEGVAVALAMVVGVAIGVAVAPLVAPPPPVTVVDWAKATYTVKSEVSVPHTSAHAEREPARFRRRCV
jgi:hypothetical protein